MVSYLAFQENILLTINQPSLWIPKVDIFVLMVVSVCFFEEPLRAFEEAHRVLKNDGYLVLGLVLSDSPWADFYKEKAKKGHPIYSHARFYSFGELSSILTQASFRVERVCTTLFEEPQDQEPVKNQEIREGF